MATTAITPLQVSTVITRNANLRQGAPNTQAPVMRKLPEGTTVIVNGQAIGETVQGIDKWYSTIDGGYLWTGACQPVTLVSPAPGGVVSSQVRVIDISHSDGVTDLKLASGSGLLGVIHKATTGATGRDDQYATRRAAAKAAGLLWGAYHWGSAAPIDQQIDNFLAWASPDAKTLVALDFEASPGNQMTLQGAKDFLQGIENKLGRKAVLYSGSYIKGELGSTVDQYFGSHRLWLAQYGDVPKVQQSWKTYWIWQYTDGESGPTPRQVPGIVGDSKSRLDCDHFAGTDSELAAQWAA